MIHLTTKNFIFLMITLLKIQGENSLPNEKNMNIVLIRENISYFHLPVIRISHQRGIHLHFVLSYQMRS